MTTNNHTVATISDEMRDCLHQIKSMVASAEAEGRDLTGAERAEKEALTTKMETLDARRSRVFANAGGLDDVLQHVRVAPGAGPAAMGRGDTLGGQLVKSEQFTTFLAHLGHGRPTSMSPIELRAATPTLPPGGGYPAVTIAPPPAGPLAPWGGPGATVAGLFPALPAQGGAISYLRDVRTGTEAGIPPTGTAPGTAKPETPLAPTLIEAALVVLATWSKVANTVPEDIPGFQSWMDSVLVAGVADAEASYIVATILATPGILPMTPVAGDTVADSILRASMLVQQRSHLPATGVVLAPDSFAALALAKASTSGTYLSGLPLSASPSMVLWGQLTLVVSAALAAGTALVVAGRAGAVYRKGTLRIDISDSNEDDFIKNLLTVRVEERVAFATYKPTGFASVTGLVTP